MLSPIGNSYGYYTSSPYATGHTAAAAHTALVNSNHDASVEVTAVADVPEVFSNEDTERVQRTPEEMTHDRRTAYEIMNSLTPRNAEHLNIPLDFMTNRPHEASDAYKGTAKKSIDVTIHAKTTEALPSHIFLQSGGKQDGYKASLEAYQSYTDNYKGFHALA